MATPPCLSENPSVAKLLTATEGGGGRIEGTEGVWACEKLAVSAIGFLILHLADRDKFDPIIPVAKNTMFRNPQTYMKNRITNSDIDFSTFSYSADYVFPENDTKVVVKEKFSDNLGNIRQNENVLYMDPIETILQIAIRRGFIVHAKVNMSKYNGDESQYLYVLERAM